jgi:hypothetical protein
MRYDRERVRSASSVCEVLQEITIWGSIGPLHEDGREHALRYALNVERQ